MKSALTCSRHVRCLLLPTRENGGPIVRLRPMLYALLVLSPSKDALCFFDTPEVLRCPMRHALCSLQFTTDNGPRTTDNALQLPPTSRPEGPILEPPSRRRRYASDLCVPCELCESYRKSAFIRVHLRPNPLFAPLREVKRIRAHLCSSVSQYSLCAFA